MCRPAWDPFRLKTPFSLFLSLRYLKPKRTFVSVVTVISMAGVFLGVWILTLVIAIMTGFNVKMRNSILGFESHLTVQGAEGELVENWEDLVSRLKEHPAVLDAASFTSSQAVMDYQSRPVVVEIRGLEMTEGAIGEKFETLVHDTNGAFDLSIREDELQPVVVGRAMSFDMGMLVGDALLFHAVDNGRELLEAQQENRKPDRDRLITPGELQVVGIFESETSQHDLETVFVPLSVGQTLANAGKHVTGIELFLADPHRVQLIKSELEPLVGDYELESWIDRNSAIFAAVDQERLNMYVLLYLIVLVAAFCIMNTMITVTTQKRGEIGLMKAVGATTTQIMGAFLGQGLIVGVIGTIAGILMAFLFLLARVPIGESIAIMSGAQIVGQENFLASLPAQLTVPDLVVISAGSFLACAFSALLPAYFSARLEAAQAIRNASLT